MIETLNGRPAGDILSRVVRITLSGHEFRLPVRSIRFNREWKATLDARTTNTITALTDAGADWEKVLAELEQDAEPFIDLLVSYAPDVLSRDLIEDLEPDPSMDVIDACREVWLAASPLVAIGVERLTAAMTEAQASGGSLPTSSQPPNTDGLPTSSKSDSPTNSSSPTSTPPPSGMSNGEAPSSPPSSTASGPGGSSPTTNARSRNGSARPRPTKSDGRSRARRSNRP